MSSTRRKHLLAAKLGSFVQQYGRKAQKGVEPNDRRYSGEIEELMKHLPPEELSALLSGDTSEPVPQQRKKKLLTPDPFVLEKKKSR